MRMFLCGFLVMFLIGLVLKVIFTDIDGLLSDIVLSAAFVCGAVSQAIKQLKE